MSWYQGSATMLSGIGSPESQCRTLCYLLQSVGLASLHATWHNCYHNCCLYVFAWKLTGMGPSRGARQLNLPGRNHGR